MKYLLSTFLVLVLLVAIFFFSPSHKAPANASGGGLRFNFIFGQSTPDDYVEEVYSNIAGDLGPNFFLGNHWDPAFTATGDGGANQGDSLTLTWSIIPDGTNMPGFAGEATCSSNLIAKFNGIYGDGPWQAEIANVFADWSSKTGNVYVQVSDDGAPWPTSGGLAGVRGDIRIGGCLIDGNSGILAYNFFPDFGGDMKIDSEDNFYNGTNLTTTFHNVISHEHGHGVAVAHVCPVNETKLMEPFVTSAFTGLQHDDIRAIQRHHGDRNELINADNDISARATDLGTPTDNVAINVQGISIDDNDDRDWFKFTAGSGDRVDVTVTPIGLTYANGPQNFNGSCTNGLPATNSLTVHNLGFEIIDSNGTSVLATGNANPAGVAEALSEISLGAAGTKYIRVFGDTTDDIQLYDFQMTLKATSVAITKTASPDPVVTGQTLNYTLTITNTGSVILTNVVVTDTVPNNTTFDSASDGGGEAGNVVSWPTITQLGPNTNVTRSFSVILAAGLSNGSTITNTAYVSASNLLATQPSNTAVTTVSAPVLTSMIFSDPNPILASANMITYTLTVQNAGGAAATNVVISNTIPASTTFNTASDGGSEASAGVIVWPVTTINVSSSITRTFKVNVTSAITDRDQLVNTVSASSAEGATIQNQAFTEVVGERLIYLPIVLKNN